MGYRSKENCEGTDAGWRYDSLLSKHDTSQSDVVCSSSWETWGYYANLKIKTERTVLKFHSRRGRFQLCVEEMYYFHKVGELRKGLYQASKMSCMQLGKNEDWKNGEEMYKNWIRRFKNRPEHHFFSFQQMKEIILKFLIPFHFSPFPHKNQFVLHALLETLFCFSVV